MIKWAGALITACGVGHTVGALVMTLPRYGGGWFDGALWAAPDANLVDMTPSAAGFWFSFYSFGLPLLGIGLTVLWMGVRAVVPPAFLAWGLIAWTVVGTALSGPSPLLLLLVAAALMLAARRRAPRLAA